MLRSMTGFASKTMEIQNITGEKAYLTLTLKSLNTRFFEAMCKLPYALQSLEIDLITLFKKELHRGKVILMVHSSNANIFKSPVQPSLTTIKSYLDAVNTAKSKFNIPGEVSIDTLINIPNVFISEETEVDEKTKKVIFTTIQELTQELIKVQQKEGAALEKDIKERCTILENEINEIKTLSDRVMLERQEITQSRLEEMNHDQSELAEIRRNQMTIDLEKLDINEEIVRFKSHLQNLKDIVRSKKIEKGRRIDFMLQELSREINTVAAKCSDFAISSLAISSKVELEKIREQNQNIV